MVPAGVKTYALYVNLYALVAFQQVQRDPTQAGEVLDAPSPLSHCDHLNVPCSFQRTLDQVDRSPNGFA